MEFQLIRKKSSVKTFHKSFQTNKSIWDSKLIFYWVYGAINYLVMLQ